MNNDNFTNSMEEDFSEPFFGKNLVIIYVICDILGLISAIGSFIFIQFFLKLNSYLKWTLKVLSLILLMSNLSIMVGLSMVKSDERFQSLLTCSLLHYSSIIAIGSSLNTSAIISSVRYLMYRQSLEAKIARHWQILLIIINGIVYNQVVVWGVFVATLQFDLAAFFKRCANIQGDTKFSINGLILWLHAFSEIIVCIFFDLKLKYRMKTKRSEPQIVPWKVPDPGREEEDLKIPTRATQVSLSSLGFVLIGSGLTMIADILGKDSLFSFVYILLSVFSSVHLPIILLFTVTHNKELAKKQPPSQLQFYDDNDENQLDQEVTSHQDSSESEVATFHHQDMQVKTTAVSAIYTIQVKPYSSCPGSKHINEIGLEDMNG